MAPFSKGKGAGAKRATKNQRGEIAKINLRAQPCVIGHFGDRGLTSRTKLRFLLNHLSAFSTVCRSTLENSCSDLVRAYTSWDLTVLGTPAFSKSYLILHNGIADPPREGESAKLLAEAVIINWNDERPSTYLKLW